MFYPFDFRDVHQSLECFFIKDFAVWREHLPQLECQRVRISAAHFGINRRFLTRRFSVQPGGLKQNRNSATRNNSVHLLAVKLDDIAGLPFDVRATHK